MLKTITLLSKFNHKWLNHDSKSQMSHIINKRFFCKILIQIFAAIFLFSSHLAQADEPITTDNRIKTYIYNENEVYPLVIFYGYQSSIELAHGEEVVTISMGDSYSWQITPVGRRLFIKPMEENMHTNMTILTNKRAYQFDLFSKKIDGAFNKELVYVMRFYYPETNKNSTIDESPSFQQNTDQSADK